jgi:Protein of unknown function (DUF3168)
VSAESTVYGWLAGHAALSALVGARIYPDVIPQDTVLPAIAYARSGTEHVSTIHGGVAGALVTVQVQSWADTRTAAEAAADAVEAALIANGEVPTARGVLFDDTTGCFGTAVDVRLLTP